MTAFNFQNNKMQIIIKQIYSYLNMINFLSENLALNINKIILDQIIINIYEDK